MTRQLTNTLHVARQNAQSLFLDRVPNLDSASVCANRQCLTLFQGDKRKSSFRVALVAIKTHAYRCSREHGGKTEKAKCDTTSTLAHPLLGLPELQQMNECKLSTNDSHPPPPPPHTHTHNREIRLSVIVIELETTRALERRCRPPGTQ